MLEISHLVKKFGPLAAVDDVSFTVAAGEVLGFLGPNGAGKSTTMKMITGFLPPSAGTAIICGNDVLARPLAAKRQIGYLPEGAPAYPDMNAGEFLGFIAHIRGYHGRTARRRIAGVAELLRIDKFLHQPIETLSKGYRRRVGVAQALLHDPAVLILDEPTDGLDPNQKHEMRAIIDAMRPHKAIVISTHLLDEVEAVCSRAIIIAQGRILADGTPAELSTRSRYHGAVRLSFSPGAAAGLAGDVARLPGIKSVETVNDGEGEGLWVFPLGNGPILGDLVEFARAAGSSVTGIRVERGRLDDVFRAITMPGAPDPAPTHEAR